MNKTLLALYFLILCGCGGGSPTTKPAPQSTLPIAESWNTTIAASPSAPSGWTLSAQSIDAASIPLNTCVTDFNNFLSPNTLQASLQSCALSTDIVPNGKSTWIRTLILGTTSAQLFSGESVSYALVIQGDDGASSAILSGTGTFANSQITGPLNCLSLNGGSCDWSTTITASVQ